MKIRVVLAMVLALGASACDPEYGELEIFVLDGTPGARASSTQMVVPVGGLLVFEAQPRSDGAREYTGMERFELRTATFGVAELRRAVLRDTWVLNGLEAGETSIQVRVDGRTVDSIVVGVEGTR